MNRRAVSPVLGLALLVGLVAVASVSLLLVSTALTDNTKSSIDQQQAEQSLGDFSKTSHDLAKGDLEEGTYDLQGAEGGTIRAIPYDGDEINITVRDGNDTIIFSITRTLGSVVYDSPDGTQLAFQGGGVWRLDQSGHAIMVDPPKFHYRDEPEPTLTFPLALVRDDFSATGRAAGTMRARETKRHYPDEPTHYNPLVNGSVTVEIDSLYCDGWERYFKERTDGTVTESCAAQGITTDSEVRLELSVPFEIDGFEQGAQFNDDVDGSYINGTYDDGGHDLESPTRMVKEKIKDCETEGTDLDGNTTIDEPGLYCAEDDEMTGDAGYDINASEGEVEIAVDGDVYDAISGSNAGINITGSENVTIWVNGDLFTGDGNPNNNVFGNESDPSQLRFFVASNNKVGDNSNFGTVYALIYAPTCDADLQGGFQLEGGLMTESAEFGGSGEITVDPSIMDLSFDYQPGDADLYFLHISETELVLDD